MLFQRSPGDAVPATQELLDLETRHCHLLCSSPSPILGLHWVSSAPLLDFITLSTQSLDLFKLSPDHSKPPSLVKSFPFDIGHYWIEAKSGYLLLAAAPPKLGLIQCFRLLSAKGGKQFIGPKFIVSVEPSVTNQWTESQANSSRLTYERDRKGQQTGLHRVYDWVCFVHLQSRWGLGKMYRVGEEDVTLMETEIRVPPGEGYEVVVSDNLVLVVNALRQETFVYDVKSKKGCFCVIHHNLPQSLPTLSLKIEIDRNQKSYFPLLTILYDQLTLSKAVPPTARPFSRHYIESESKLDPFLLYSIGDIAIDMRAGRCYKVRVDAAAMADEHPDLLESVLFLMRRVGCKQAAYACLKEAILRKVGIAGVSELFFRMNRVYKQAAVERRYSESKVQAFRKSRMLGSPMTPRKLAMYPSDPELKMESGETVMLQADVLSLLFNPLSTDIDVDLDFLVLVMLEYQRSLLDFDIQIHNSLHLLIAKTVIKAGNFVLLEELVASQTISDSRELATVLLAVSSPKTAVYPPLFPLALDMMKRLSLHDDLLDLFIDLRLIYEAVQYANSLPSHTEVDWKRIAGAAEELGDESLKASVVRRMQH